VGVAALSVRIGPLPLSSHFIQLAFGLLAVFSAIQAARRSTELARDFWWFAAIGFAIWCLGQALDTFFGLILNIPFERRWGLDVLYYAWPAALVICLSITPKRKKDAWALERTLDLAQAGILLVLLYMYFSGAPLHARGPGVWRLSLATDGLIAAGFFGRAFWARSDPTRVLFRRIGYFRLFAFLTDLYFVLGFPASTRTNWGEIVWSAQWLVPVYAAADWDPASTKQAEFSSADPFQSSRSRFLPLTFPFLVLLVAAEMTKGQFVIALFAVLLSLTIFYARLFLSRRQEERSSAERDSAIEALADSEERFRALFEGAPIGISILDLAGREVASNKAYRDLLGIGPEDAINKDKLLSFTNSAAREDQRLLFERIASGELVRSQSEVEYMRNDGVAVFVDLSTFLQRDHFGKPQFVISMALDISDRKRLEKQVRQTQKMETIGRLAGGVAHDFNNLLTIIVGYCDLIITDASASTEILTRTTQVDKAAKKAAALTHQLLAFSRQQILQPRSFNLNALISDSGKMLARLIGEDIEVNVSLAPNLGTVLADPGQIEQIVFNLSLNARDAMPDGGKLSIATSNAEIDEEFVQAHVGARPGRYVMLAVRDTGVGIDDATMAHIFEPFFTTKELGKGTGLGLSMVYGIVKQSNGYLDVQSELGKGTEFRIYLPRIDRQPDAAIAEAETRRERSGSEGILLVEDDPDLRKLVSDLLTSQGYNVAVASCPTEALAIEQGSSNDIDLLLTDLVMPGISGKELASRIRQIHPDIRVLYMSGYTDPALVQSAASDVTASFIQKPFTPTMLAQTVRKIFDRPYTVDR